jgi:hypothetical protein
VILGSKGVKVCQAPCVLIKYDCATNIANIVVERSGVGSNCVYGYMHINFNETDPEYIWELNDVFVNETRKKLAVNVEELKSLTIL